MRSLFFVALFLSMIGMAEAQDYQVGDIFISQPWARVSQGLANEAAVYMTLFNHGAGGDRLISASSPVAERSELHLQWHPDHDPAIQAIPIPPGDPAIMSAAIEVTPGQPTVLAPGGMHLMLIGLRQPLRQTPLFPLSLTFEHAGTVEVQCIAAAPGPIHSPIDH